MSKSIVVWKLSLTCEQFLLMFGKLTVPLEGKEVQIVVERMGT